MENRVPVPDFLARRSGCVLLDVRSPGEYAQGHIPGAVTFPLFSDEERARVGTFYKQKGPEAALELGLKYAGPKMAGFVRKARELAPGRRLAVHCWRGGQRSQSVAWLLRQAGFEVMTLEGGYNTKQYGVKLAYLDSKFTDANSYASWTNFYMRDGLDMSPLPPNNDYQKWMLSGYWKQLPWDSAILAKFTQSKLTNNVSLTGTAFTSSLKPVGNTPTGQAQPPGVGYLFTQPVDASGANITNFNGDIKTTTFNIAWNASPLAKLDMRVYYDYYDKENNSTEVGYNRGFQGTSCATPPANSATCYTIGPLTAAERGRLRGEARRASELEVLAPPRRRSRTAGAAPSA